VLVDGVLLLVGFVLLIVGADYLVRGAVSIAERLGVSPLIIGLTIVACGTSLPELVVSVRATLAGSAPLAIGNVVGSNICNILLILGTAALLAPLRCDRVVLLRDGSMMLIATAYFAGATLVGGYGPAYGIVAILGLVAAMLFSYWHDRKSGDDLHQLEAEEVSPIQGSWALLILAVVLGLAGVIGGAELLVESAVSIARGVGVSEEVIGLTLVAFGTSVPELATTVVAAMRKHADVAIGNVLGSNLFNLLGILGVTSLIDIIPTPPATAAFDVWVLIAVSVLMIVFMRTGWRLGRREGAVLVLLYAVFVVAQFLGIGQMMVEEMGPVSLT